MSPCLACAAAGAMLRNSLVAEQDLVSNAAGERWATCQVTVHGAWEFLMVRVRAGVEEHYGMPVFTIKYKFLTTFYEGPHLQYAKVIKFIISIVSWNTAQRNKLRYV